MTDTPDKLIVHVEKILPPPVEVVRGLRESSEYGKISKIIFPNKSQIWISKKGWNLLTPDGEEINLPYSEINMAIQETIKQGYIS